MKSFLAERSDWAQAAGISPNSILLDAGLDLGKTPAMSAELLRTSAELAELGHPILLSASNKGFLGHLCDADINQRDVPSMAAHALGLLSGCQVLRVHNVKATKTICKTMARLWEASGRGKPEDSFGRPETSRHHTEAPHSPPHRIKPPHRTHRPCKFCYSKAPTCRCCPKR